MKHFEKVAKGSAPSPRHVLAVQRYCPVLNALEGSALWGNTLATAFLHDQNRTIPFGLIVPQRNYSQFRDCDHGAKQRFRVSRTDCVLYVTVNLVHAASSQVIFRIFISIFCHTCHVRSPLYACRLSADILPSPVILTFRVVTLHCSLSSSTYIVTFCYPPPPCCLPI